jgi:hypothetical protein
LSNKLPIKTIVFLALIIASGYLFENLNKDSQSHKINILNCKISESSCNVDLSNSKSIKINISPKGIPETVPLLINVGSKGVIFKDVSVVFEGVEIDHKLPAFPLNRINNYSFSGKALLSICSLSEMNWIVHVILKSSNDSWKVSFPFKSKRN